MTQYISKDTLVAEINKRIKLNDSCIEISKGNDEFYRGAFGAATQSGSLTEVYTLNDKNIEVLGNVYDNPELFINSNFPHLPADA